MKLKSLISSLVEETSNDPDGGLTDSEIYEGCALILPSQPDLTTPLRMDPRPFFNRDGLHPLTGEEDIESSLLLFVWLSHDMEMYLKEVTLSDVEKFLGSMSGPINPFVTYAIVLEDGKVKPYTLKYKDGSGVEMVYNPYRNFGDPGKGVSDIRFSWSGQPKSKNKK